MLKVHLLKEESSKSEKEGAGKKTKLEKIWIKIEHFHLHDSVGISQVVNIEAVLHT